MAKMIKIKYKQEDGIDYEKIRGELRAFLEKRGLECDGGGYDLENNIYEDFYYKKPLSNN